MLEKAIIKNIYFLLSSDPPPVTETPRILKNGGFFNAFPLSLVVFDIKRSSYISQCKFNWRFEIHHNQALVKNCSYPSVEGRRENLIFFTTSNIVLLCTFCLFCYDTIVHSNLLPRAANNPMISHILL